MRKYVRLKVPLFIATVFHCKVFLARLNQGCGKIEIFLTAVHQITFIFLLSSRQVFQHQFQKLCLNVLIRFLLTDYLSEPFHSLAGPLMWVL
jgi:hypothetical protein